jgi:hypothetical protein
MGQTVRAALTGKSPLTKKCVPFILSACNLVSDTISIPLIYRAHSRITLHGRACRRGGRGGATGRYHD